MLILFWLTRSWPITLRGKEYVFSDCTVSSYSKETELGSSDQEGHSLAGDNTVVVLVPFRAWKCVPAAIFGGVDISEFPESHFLRQMSSQWESQKLHPGLVSHELMANLSEFDLFLVKPNSHIIQGMHIR